MASREQTFDYPPADHVMRDLRITFAPDGELDRALLPVLPPFLDANGALRVGVLSIFIDIMGGGAAIRAVDPDWIATGNLAVQVHRPIRTGVVRGETRVLRAGRRSVVIAFDAHADGDGPASVATATMTFSRLPRRDLQNFANREDDPAQGPRNFPVLGEGLQVPVLERIGFRTLDAKAGVVEVPRSPYVINTLRSIQGGVVAMIAEVSCETIAASQLDRPVRMADVAVDYLELARVGPVRTRARILRRSADTALVYTELRDAGDGDRLLTIATATVLTGSAA